MICYDLLSNLCLKKFYNIPSCQRNICKAVYLVNTPIVGVDILLSEDKILMGSKCRVSYLKSLTYNVGYLIESMSNFILKESFILLGGITSDITGIGLISPIYYDQNLTILNNKKHSSYIIVPTYSGDLPQPIKLEEE